MLPLDPKDIDAIAARLADLLERPVGGRAPKGLATAKEVAACLGVAREWVYANQERLGAIRLGDGPKARLRFDLERTAEALRAESASQGPRRARRVRRTSLLPAGVELLEGRNRRDRRAV